ncbi:hypothetical protein D0859_03985 [Hortaea werneckii]|uniref:Uncharacterized protein n=1 Tax=Hortaea werneckii TaxID=91943 RepID=A0A3M7J252_HORWE|nr:hypothetical protein KC329_g334 [Hortaea werneckii]RMZ31878.1 hypothetical protein D0859_03985 [Hortaea werneckii]
MARLRSAPSTHPPSPAKAQPKRQALREKTNTTRASQAPVYADDGNTEGLIKTAKTRRGRQKKATQNEDELVMTGGLGGQEDNDAPRSDVVTTTDELAKSDGPPPPTAKKGNGGRRPPRMTRKPVQSQAQSQVMAGLKKRMEEAAQQEAEGEKTRSAHVERVATEEVALSKPPPRRSISTRQSTSTAREGQSELSLTASPPPSGKANTVQARRSSVAPPSSVIRPQNTPAAETSILALKNFKRRPRQPSMLAMVQQRTARPSAIDAGPETDDPSVFDLALGQSEDEEDDFRPEAEGTPMHPSKAKRISSASSKKKQGTSPAVHTVAKPPAAHSKKRNSGAMDTSMSALDALRAKRQRQSLPVPTMEGDVVASTLSAASPRHVSRPGAPSQPQADSEVQVINSSPSSSPLSETSELNRTEQNVAGEYVVPSTEQEHEEDLYGATPPRSSFQQQRQRALLAEEEPEHDVPNATMAEPASSSPLPHDPFDAAEPDVYADPLSQVTQQPPEPERQVRSKKKVKPLSTANLQALLPKRRARPKPRHRTTEYDFTSDEDEESEMDADHLDDDEDELGGGMRRRTTAASKGRKGAVPSTKAKVRDGKTAQAPRKSSAAPPGRKSTAATAKTRKGQPKTYGRAANASDKENEDAYESIDEDGDDTTDLPAVDMRQVAKSKELEEAKKKFEEVDGWDMEFESMSQDDHRSSSQAWR